MLVAAIMFLVRILRFFHIIFWKIQGTLLLKISGIDTKGSTKFYGTPILEKFPGSIITLGARTVLCSHSRYTALGISRPVIIRTLSSRARITIGDDVGLSGAVICAQTSIEIGDECLFGADVQITDTDFHAISPKHRRFEKDLEAIQSAPIKIGKNVFLGAGVRILKGVSIGEDSVIGAGAVVTQSIPAGSIAAGVPARVVGKV